MNKKNTVIYTLHGAVFFTKTTCSHSEQGITVYPCWPWPVSLDYPFKKVLTVRFLFFSSLSGVRPAVNSNSDVFGFD